MLSNFSFQGYSFSVLSDVRKVCGTRLQITLPGVHIHVTLFNDYSAMSK